MAWYQVAGSIKEGDGFNYVGMYDRKAEAIRDAKALFTKGQAGTPWFKVAVVRFTAAYEQGETVFSAEKA